MADQTTEIGPISRPRPHSDTREYLAGGNRPSLAGGWGEIARMIREATHEDPTMGDYEAMLGDPKVKSTIAFLVASALQDGIQFSPSVDDSQVDDERPGGYTEAEADRAWSICQFAERATSDMTEPLEEVFRQVAFDGMVFRGGLAEKVYIEAPRRDPGKLYLDRINPKHRVVWRLVVDGQGNIRGVEPVEARNNRRTTIDISKFIFMAWDRRSGSIFGTSVLDAAWPAWNFKAQLMPIWWDYLALFGVPNYHASPGPDAEPRRPIDPKTGEEDMSVSPQHPVVALFNEMVKILGGGGRLLVTDHGTEVNILEPTSDGPFEQALHYLDKEIVQSILWATRAVMEAEHSSKSDNEGALDVVGTAVQSVKSWIGGVARQQVLRDLIRINYGDEDAERFTPIVSLGRIDRRDFSRFANALSKMYQVGLITPDERRDALSLLGFRFRRTQSSNSTDFSGNASL